MTSSSDNALSYEEALSQYQSNFANLCKAILTSKEYRARYSFISRGDRTKIRKNHTEISSYAAKYLINKVGTKLPEDESVLDQRIEESLTAALIAFNP